jgi:hypothetical protein
MALKHLDECGIPKRLSSPSAFASHQEQVWASDIERALLHNVSSNGLQCFRLMQVYHALTPRLRTRTLRVVSAVSDDHPTVSVLYVIKMKVEDFAWT